jgi:hypothetical protein
MYMHSVLIFDRLTWARGSGLNKKQFWMYATSFTQLQLSVFLTSVLMALPSAELEATEQE